MTNTKPKKFSDFTPLTIDDQSFINTYNEHFQPYSDFNFTSILSWGGGKAEIALLNNNLVLKMPGYLSGDITYSLLGKEKVDESLLTLLTVTNKLHFVPQTTVNAIIEPSLFNIDTDANNADYIYKNRDLATLSGKNYKKLRNKIHTFEESHIGKRLRTYTVANFSNEIIASVKEIHEKWGKETRKTAHYLASEERALHTLLDHSSDIPLLLTCVVVDGELKAFSINEILNKDYAICHFEKALTYHHANIYPYLVHQVAKALLDRGVPYVNWEQDLGIEGLRQSKKSYQPHTMLKKYTISARSQLL